MKKALLQDQLLRYCTELQGEKTDSGFDGTWVRHFVSSSTSLIIGHGDTLSYLTAQYPQIVTTKKKKALFVPWPT